MKNYKNYLIALLTGLLVLSLSTQQAQSAGSSKDAKIVQYDQCITVFGAARNSAYLYFDSILTDCAKYKP